MKLKNSEFKNHSTLIKLYFLKHRIYKNNISKIPFQNSLNFFEVKLKQVLNLIHLYHFENKKILFIGFPYIKKKRLFKNFNHLFVPRNFWMYSNSINTNKDLLEVKQNLDFQKINLTVKDYDLILFLNPSLQHLEMLQIFKKFQIPLILIGSQKKLNLKFSKYHISIFILPDIIKQFFLFLIYSILKDKKRKKNN